MPDGDDSAVVERILNLIQQLKELELKYQTVVNLKKNLDPLAQTEEFEKFDLEIEKDDLK